MTLHEVLPSAQPFLLLLTGAEEGKRLVLTHQLPTEGQAVQQHFPTPDISYSLFLTAAFAVHVQCLGRTRCVSREQVLEILHVPALLRCHIVHVGHIAVELRAETENEQYRRNNHRTHHQPAVIFRGKGR